MILHLNVLHVELKHLRPLLGAHIRRAWNGVGLKNDPARKTGFGRNADDAAPVVPFGDRHARDGCAMKMRVFGMFPGGGFGVEVPMELREGTIGEVGMA